MSGATPVLFPIPSWHIQRQLYLSQINTGDLIYTNMFVYVSDHGQIWLHGSDMVTVSKLPYLSWWIQTWSDYTVYASVTT
jgi:hypothetical protein